jgi:hypothetical protein
MGEDRVIDWPSQQAFGNHQRVFFRRKNKGGFKKRTLEGILASSS